MNKTNWNIKFEKRFWSKVQLPQDLKNDCWIWIAGKGRDGYGRFYVKNTTIKDHRVRANRLSYEYYYGIPPNNMEVCHKCDNPACVNPNHLFLGSKRDNQLDKIAKNRQARGTINGRSKLTEFDIINIRQLYKQGTTCQMLANMYNMGWTTINNIIKRNIWTHI